MSDLLYLFKQSTGFFDVPRRILLQAHFSHLVNEFGVEETLFARLCLGDPGLKGRNAVLIENPIVG
jgi:hypothetical protein